MRVSWALAIFSMLTAGVLGAACLEDVTDYCYVGIDCPGDGGASTAGAGGTGGAGGMGGASPCMPQPDPIQGCAVATCACPHTSIPIEPEDLPHCFGLLATEHWSEPDGAEKAEALLVMQNDDIVIAGRYNGTFDLGVGTAPNAGMGEEELWVARVDRDLTPLWQIGTSTQSTNVGFEPGGSGAKTHLASAFDSTLNSETIVVLSSVEGEHDLDGVPINAPFNTRDCVLLRLTPDGSLLNVLYLRPGVGSICDANGITATDDALYVVGEFTGTLNPVPAAANADGCVEMASNGDDDGFVIKLDHQLNPQWCRHFSGGEEDDAYAVAAGPDGGAVVVGDFSGNLQVGDTSLDANGQDAVVLYYEPDGGVRWATSWGDVPGESREQRGSTVTVTDDAIFVGGSHEGSVLIDGTSYSGQLDQLDMVVLRLDLDGRIEWQRVFTGGDDDDIFRMTTDALNVYVAGTTRGVIDLHQDPAINQPAGGSDDAFLLSLDRSCGHTIAARRFAGSRDQIARGLGLLSDGTIVMSLTYEDDTQWSDNQPLVNTTGNDDIALGLFLP